MKLDTVNYFLLTLTIWGQLQNTDSTRIIYKVESVHHFITNSDLFIGTSKHLYRYEYYNGFFFQHHALMKAMLYSNNQVMTVCCWICIVKVL